MICVIIPCDQLQAWIRRTQASMVLHARFPKEQPERAHRLCECQKGIGQPTQSGWPWPPWVSESLSHNSFLSVYNFFGPLSLWVGYTSKSFFFTASGAVTSQSKQNLFHWGYPPAGARKATKRVASLQWNPFLSAVLALGGCLRQRRWLQTPSQPQAGKPPGEEGGVGWDQAS